MTHTPGPWEVTATVDEGDILVETTRSRTICEVHNHANAEPGDVEANARLIAAAPELLEALKAIMREFPATQLKVRKDYHKMVAIEAAKTAIKKATSDD